MTFRFTDCVPEVLNFRQSYATLLRVELDVRALTPDVHFAIVAQKLLFSLPENDDVVRVAFQVLASKVTVANRDS